MKSVVILAALACFGGQGYAATSYTWAVIGGTDAGGHTVNASATLSLSLVGSTEELTVVLNNTTANNQVISDGENITGLKLTINPNDITGASMDPTTLPTGDQIQVTSQSSTNNLGTGTLTHWTAATSLSTLTLTTIGSGQAINSVIGEPNASGVYPVAGGSLTGNTKWPFAQELATFTIDLTGTNITLADFTAAQIGFGTLGTNYIVSPFQATPEPGTLWLLGAGAVLLGLRRIQWKSAAPKTRD